MKLCGMNRTIVLVAALSCFLAAAAHADGHLRAHPLGQAVLKTDEPKQAGAEAAKPHTSGTDLLQTKFGHLKARFHQWLHPLSAAAVVTTVALQLSPLPSTLEIRRDRDVKRYDGYPYFAVLAGATQWCIYGSYAAMTSKDMNFLTMVAANGPGVAFGIFYISNYFRFIPTEDARNAALKGYLKIGLAILIAEFTSCIVLGRQSVFWLGLLGAIGSAQIAVSPFKTLPEVLRTRSTRSWPLDLCMWNLIQSWFTGSFGVANDDPWVWIPNVVGVAAAVVQLTLIALFWERPFGPHGTCVKLKAAAALA